MDHISDAQPNPKADSQSPAEGLRQQLETLALEIGQQVTNSYEMKHGLWEGLSVQNVNSINKAEKALTAYAATVEREAETKGVGLGYTLASEKLFVDVADFHKFTEELAGGPIWTHQFADKKTWDKLREMYETQRLAALQGPQDGDAE